MESVMEETAILLIDDYDLHLSKQHTQGARRQWDFETPYAANLRALPFLISRFQRFRESKSPRIIFGCATFGANRRRIVESYKAMQCDPESVLICAKWIPPELATKQGKNEHIADILQQHYKRLPHVRITQVVFCDDDVNNLALLELYRQFVTNNAPWNMDVRFNVPVHGMLIPRPKLLECMGVNQKGIPALVPKLQFDELLQTNVCCELPESEEKYLACLKRIEVKIAELHALEMQPRVLKWPRYFQPLAPKRAVNRLTSSVGETLLLEDQQEKKHAVTPVNTPERSLLSSFDSADENRLPEIDSFGDERERLTKSWPC